MKTFLLLLFLHSHSSGPKADSSPKVSRGLGGLKSEFLKQSTARGFRTQDQSAGSKGRKVAAKGAVCVCAHVGGWGSVLWVYMGAKGVCVCVCVHVLGWMCARIILVCQSVCVCL